MDDVRPIVRCSDDDLVAAMQILACIARPHDHRATVRAGDLMEQLFYARKRLRREKLPELPFRLKKKGEIQRQIGHLKKDLGHAFIAARWYQRILGNKQLTVAGIKPTRNRTSLRKLAAYQSQFDHKENGIGNVLDKIWIPRKPVLHMALAAGNAIAGAHIDRQVPSTRATEIIAQIEALLPQCQSAWDAGNGTAPAIAEYNRLFEELSAQRRRDRTGIDIAEVIFDPVWVPRALKEAEEWHCTATAKGIIKAGEAWLFCR